MNFTTLILASINMLIQNYADYDKEFDYKKTLTDLKDDLGFPRIRVYDFIVGE